MKSWLKYRLRTAAILLSATLLTTSCLQSDFDEPLLAGDTVKVSFNPTLDNNETTRVGEGLSVNKLYAELYLNGNLIGERHNYDVSSGTISGFSMELLKNQKYTIVFWAQNTNCGAYNTSDLSKIKINYPEKIDFSDIKNIEKYDAFYAKCDVTVNAKTISDGVDIKLTRPFALVVAGTDEQVEDDTTSSLTFSSIATQFDAFTGKASVDTEGATTTISFQPKNSIKVPGKEQVMLGIAYVLPIPNLEKTTVTVTTTLDGQSKETGINIPNLTANKRYNLLGSNLVVDAGWGGTTYLSLPAVATDGWIHITEAEQLATLLRDGYDNSGNTINGIHLCASFNMGGKEITPTETATFKNVIIDGAAYSVNSTYNLDTPIDENRITEGGGIYELKGLNISGKGVFNSTDTFTARYIKFTNVTVNSAAEAGGVVGTATGSLTLTNITVSGTVTGANKVGGLVGYISNSKDNEATISNCHSTATVKTNNESDKTNHEIFVGGLVGCFRGYTKDEVLTFEGGCSANETGYFTPFCDDEKACFNSDCTVTENLLGGEENCRGSVYYGESRFFYRWDGVRSVKPIFDGKETDKKVFIYSPYDLAYCQSNSYTSMTFHNDVDMGGQGIDGKFYIPEVFASKQSSTDDRPFNPISTVKTLNGAKSSTDNYTVYNLYIKRLNSGTGNAFIQTANGTTSHENLNFNNCCTVATAQIYYENGIEDEAKAYGAIVCSEPSGAYTMQNIHAVGCKVFAAQKLGTLSSIVYGGTITNCSVTNCRVENYQCKDVNERFSSGNRSFSIPIKIPFLGTKYFDIKAELYEYYYCYGEAGGLCGFVTGNTNISNCNVTGTTVHAYGQGDKMGEVNIIESDSGLVTNSTAKAGLALIGLYKIPGRHVSTFIGDIRAAGNVSITNCHVSDDCTCTQTYDNHNSTYPYIGQAYYVLYLDTAGTVTVDGKKLTLADCKTTTIR